jgi:hypothetical protein
MHTVTLQVRRLRSGEPEDATFLFRKWSDFDFLVVALTRLRRSAQLACKLPQARASLEPALQEFDARLPGLRLVRNVAEHIDEYAIDQGHSKSVERFALEVSSLSARGPTLRWLGSRVNANTALRVAERLFAAMQSAKNAARTNA